MAAKVLPFIENYGRELRMKENIRRKGKTEKVIDFVEKMRKFQKEIGTALRKGDVEYKELSVQGETSKKLTERYVGLYVVKEIVSKNVVKLKLPASIRIYPAMNISRIVRYCYDHYNLYLIFYRYLPHS